MRRKTFLNIFPESYCRFKKKHYLCIAIERDSNEKLNGALVQLVRIHACHAWGHGFESRTHRNNIPKPLKVNHFQGLFSWGLNRETNPMTPRDAF